MRLIEAAAVAATWKFVCAIREVKYDFHQELPVRRLPLGGDDDNGAAAATRLWIPEYFHKPAGDDEVNG